MILNLNAFYATDKACMTCSIFFLQYRQFQQAMLFLWFYFMHEKCVSITRALKIGRMTPIWVHSKFKISIVIKSICMSFFVCLQLYLIKLTDIIKNVWYRTKTIVASTYDVSCSSIVDAFVTSRFTTGPIRIFEYWKCLN